MDRTAPLPATCSTSRQEATTPATWTRARPRDPANHHLWRNGRLWWIAFTVHTHDGRVLRLRRSLGTRDVRDARRMRDEIFDRARDSDELALVEGRVQRVAS